MFTITGKSPSTKDVYLTGKLEILVDSEGDLSSLPSDCAPGSIAYTADLSLVWIRANNKEWTQVQMGG